MSPRPTAAKEFSRAVFEPMKRQLARRRKSRMRVSDGDRSNGQEEEA
jgi:hypothetical protein